MSRQQNILVGYVFALINIKRLFKKLRKGLDNQWNSIGLGAHSLDAAKFTTRHPTEEFGKTKKNHEL